MLFSKLLNIIKGIGDEDCDDEFDEVQKLLFVIIKHIGLLYLSLKYFYIHPHLHVGLDYILLNKFSI